MSSREANEAREALRDRVVKLGKLVGDLWWFIENVTDEDPTRNERFFALRERVRTV